MTQSMTVRFTGIVAVAVLALAGCVGTSDTPPPADTPVATPGDAPVTTAPEATQAPATETSKDRLAPAKAAIETAETGKGTAVSIDFDDDHWEVKTVDGTTKYKYRVSLDGKQIQGQPVTDTDDDVAKDVARVQRAKVTLAQALDKAIAAQPGAIDEAELDTENGKLSYEVNIDTSGGDDVDVSIDALTGAVIAKD